MLFVITLLLTIISVLFVFTLPEPIRPRTSIGFMISLAVFGTVISVLIKGTKLTWLNRQTWEPLHYAVFSYVVAVLLSLVFTKTIQDTTPLKLLLSGVALFLMAGEFLPTDRHKQLLIHSIGAIAVIIATLGWLQIVFPGIMNAIAEEFLHGRSAYGITIEFDRGRLLHWGALVFIFPFFYASTLLLSWRSRIWTSLYIVYGYSAMLMVVAVSNFRWLFIVFFVVSAGFFWYAYRAGFITKKKIYYIGLTIMPALLVGVIVAHFIFGYSLLDRFLLKDTHRDITETLGRVTLYNQALTVFQAYPIFGAGYGNYYSVVWPFPHMQYFSVFDQFELVPVPIAAHNEFYTVLAETGVFGFISYLLMVYLIGKRLFIHIFKTPTRTLDHILALTLGASYAAIFLYIMFENMYPQNIAFLLFIGAVSHKWIISVHTSS